MHNRRARFGYALLLAATVLAVMLAIELRRPYYFLQDDNRDFALPCLLHNWRALRGGEIAQFNFHQFAGVPHLSNGASGALNVPGYAATFASYILLGQPFGAVDFLVTFYLITGAAGGFLLLRLITGDARAAFWGALTYELNSFNIYVSAGWSTLSGSAAYFPWMLYFALRLFDGTPYAAVGLLTAHLLLVFIGYPEQVLHCGAFELMVFTLVAMLQFRLHRRRVVAAVRRYAANWALTIVFSLPILLPMWHQATISAARRQALAKGEFEWGAFDLVSWFSGLLNPFSNARYNARAAITAVPYLSHIGYLTVVLIGVGVIAFFRKALDARRMKYFFICWAGALVSLFWSVNAYAEILYAIPVLNRFRWPFKLQIHTAFFLVAMATVGLAWLLGVFKSRGAARAVFAAAIVATLANFLALYLLRPPRLFLTHQESIPLVEPLQEQLNEGRLISIGYRSGDQKSANSIGYDYATLWGLQSIAGYDTLVPASNRQIALGLNYCASYADPPNQLPFAHLRRWGVRWYIVKNGVPEYAPVLLANGLIPTFHDADRTVYQDPEAAPLVSWESGAVAGIDYHLTTNSIQVDVTSSQEARLHLRFASNPFFAASIDGLPVGICTDEYDQMSLRIPPGQHRIVVRYRDPYLALGTLLASAVAVVLAGITLVRRARVAAPAECVK